MNKHIFLIGNPIAGGGALKNIMKAVKILEKKGLDVKLMLTSKKGDAEEFARQISKEHQNNSTLLIISAGGDGTYNEVANGLVYSNIPMAILPLGTTSVLAKELKIPGNINEALDIALKGNAHTIHLGRITCTYRSSPITKHFLLMAGIGFDAAAVYKVSDKVKKHYGKASYIISGIKTLLSYMPEPIYVEYNSHKKSCFNVIVGKAACYGGNFKITPDAKLTDPNFYVFLTHKKDRLNLLKIIFSIIIKRDLRSKKDISYFKADNIYISGRGHIQVDGDYIGELPAKIDIVTDALRLVY
jgi:YegS/Rv2252/BmrU family lipid kinase